MRNFKAGDFAPGDRAVTASLKKDGQRATSRRKNGRDPNSAQALADRIETDIEARNIPAGKPVGTEQQLRARYGAGVALLRQAARILEQRGVAYRRRGNLGGLIVMAEKLDAIGHTLATFLEHSGARLESFEPFAEIISKIAFDQAVPNLTMSVADNLRRQIRALERDQTSFWKILEGSVRLRVAIVDAARNPLLSLIYRTIVYTIVDVIPFEREDPQELSNDRESTFGFSSGLVEALIAGDLEAYQQITRQNVEFGEARSEAWKHLQSMTITQSLSDRSSDTSAQYGPLSKRLARAILQDIRQAGWPVGAKIGAELDLMRRYQVSRSIFRQAVRLLEQYSAAEMRRGPHGGLVVASPSPDDCINAASAYLKRCDLSIDHIRPLQTEILTRTAGMLARRLSQEALAELRAELSATMNLRGGDLRQGLLAFQRRLASLSGNTPILFFLDLTLTLMSPRDIGPQIDDEEIRRCVKDTLPRLLDALANCDAPYARRALIQYLNMETTWLSRSACGFAELTQA